MEDIFRACDNIFKKVAEFQLEGLNQIERAERRLQEFLDETEQTIQHGAIKKEQKNNESTFNSTRCFSAHSPRMTRSRAKLLDQSSLNISKISLAESTIWEKHAKCDDPKAIVKPDLTLISSTPLKNVQEEKKVTNDDKIVLRKTTKLAVPLHPIKEQKTETLANPNTHNKLTINQIRNHFATRSATAKANEGKVSKSVARQRITQMKAQKVFTQTKKDQVSKTVTNISIMKELCVFKSINSIPKLIAKPNFNNKTESKEMVLYKPKETPKPITNGKLKTAAVAEIKAIEHIHPNKENIPTVLKEQLKAIGDENLSVSTEVSSNENVPPAEEGALKAVKQEYSKVVEDVNAKNEVPPPATLNQAMLNQTFLIPEVKKSPNIQYDFDMLKSDDSTDEEGKTSKRPTIPAWSRAPERVKGLENQRYLPMKHVDTFFSVEPRSPRAQEIFPHLKTGVLRRESSLVWKDHVPASTARVVGTRSSSKKLAQKGN